jgi:hypothetical protein
VAKGALLSADKRIRHFERQGSREEGEGKRAESDHRFAHGEP